MNLKHVSSQIGLIVYINCELENGNYVAIIYVLSKGMEWCRTMLVDEMVGRLMISVGDAGQRFRSLKRLYRNNFKGSRSLIS